MKEDYLEKFLNKFNSLAKGNFELLSEYKGYHENIQVKCLKCGKVFSITGGGFSGKCKYCNNGQKLASKEKLGQGRKNIDDFKKEVIKIDKNYRCLSKDYMTNKIPLKFKHLECDRTFMLSPNGFLNGRRCPYCGLQAKRLKLNKPNYLENLIKDEPDYEWLEPYKGSNKTKHKIRHKVCNNTYMVRPNDFQQGYRCPYCNIAGSIPSFSKLHKDLIKILSQKEIIYTKEMTFSLCKDQRLLCYDFYLVNYNLLIEIDGLQHFKQPTSSVLSLERNFRYDKIKNDFAKENYINLLRINYKCKKSDLIKIIEEIVETNGNLSKEFVLENHLYFIHGKKKYNLKGYYTYINKNYFKER